MIWPAHCAIPHALLTRAPGTVRYGTVHQWFGCLLPGGTMATTNQQSIQSVSPFLIPIGLVPVQALQRTVPQHPGRRQWPPGSHPQLWCAAQGRGPPLGGAASPHRVGGGGHSRVGRSWLAGWLDRMQFPASSPLQDQKLVNKSQDVCGGRAKTTDVYGSLGFCELMCRSQFTSVSTV